MQFRTAGLAFVGAALFVSSVVAQPAAAPPGATPPVIVAAAKLPTVVDAPRHFKVLSVTLAPDQKSSVTGPAGVIYQTAGSTIVSLGGETKTVNAGEGLYIPAGAAAQLQAGPGAPSNFLHYFLATAADLDRPAESAPAVVREIYRSPGALPGLKPGTYDLTFQRAVFAPQMAATNPHHRAGGALYYIVSGTGMNTIDGQTMARGPGSFIYEPYGMVHQWANPSAEPVVRLVFNINPEGSPPVVQGAPAN
jgi:quercetin dioxygenase-like cupin family protein